MSYKEELEKVEQRIEKYWSTDEINIDLANQIVNDCENLINDVKSARLMIQQQGDNLGKYIMFQNIVEKELGKDEFYRLLGLWQKAIKEEK
jgi:hypothetical protein